MYSNMFLKMLGHVKVLMQTSQSGAIHVTHSPLVQPTIHLQCMIPDMIKLYLSSSDVKKLVFK